MWRKARTNASWAMSGASSRSPHSPTAEATAMSSNRSMSSGQALASPRWAALTNAAQRSRSSISVITREEPARARPVTARPEGRRPPDRPRSGSRWQPAWAESWQPECRGRAACSCSPGRRPRRSRAERPAGRLRSRHGHMRDDSVVRRPIFCATESALCSRPRLAAGAPERGGSASRPGCPPTRAAGCRLEHFIGSEVRHGHHCRRALHPAVRACRAPRNAGCYGVRTICVQRNSAIFRPVDSLVTTASQTCV